MATVMETIVTRRSKEYEEQIYALILSSANQRTSSTASCQSLSWEDMRGNDMSGTLKV